MSSSIGIAEQLYLSEVKELESPDDILKAMLNLGKSYDRRAMIKLVPRGGERKGSVWVWPGQLMDDVERESGQRLGIYRKLFDRIGYDNLRIRLVRQINPVKGRQYYELL